MPYITSDWKVLFEPEKHGNYVNDHTVVLGSDGKWHLYGIKSFWAFAKSMCTLCLSLMRWYGMEIDTVLTDDYNKILNAVKER